MSLRSIEPQRTRLTRWEAEELALKEAERKWHEKSSEAKAEDLRQYAEQQMEILFDGDKRERQEWEDLFKQAAVTPRYISLNETSREKKERFCLLPEKYSTHMCFEVACPKCHRVSYADYEPEKVEITGPAEEVSICCHCGGPFMTFTEGVRNLKDIRENSWSLGSVVAAFFWASLILVFLLFGFVL